MSQSPEFEHQFSPVEMGKNFLRGLGIEIDIHQRGNLYTGSLGRSTEIEEETHPNIVGFWLRAPIIGGIVDEALKDIGLKKKKDRK